MNKRTSRCISLILSLAVMISSLAYIAFGVNAAGDSPKYVYSETDRTSYDVVNGVAKSSNEDIFPQVKSDPQTFSYSTVLREDADPDGKIDKDIYFDIFKDNGITSVDCDDTVKVIVTMENSTCSDYDDDNIDLSNREDVSKKLKYENIDLTSMEFSLGYDSDLFTLKSSYSNIPDGVQYVNTESRENSSVKVSYPSEIKACEMLYFYFEFTPKASTSSGETSDIGFVGTPKVTTAPEARKPSVGCADDLKFTVYKSDENNTLKHLEITYKENGSSSAPSKTAYLTPEFSPEITEYFVTVPKDAQIDATYEPTDVHASAVFAGTVDTGLNELTVTVDPKKGSDRVYKIYAKELATDTLADPKTVLTKTIEYSEPDGIEVYALDTNGKPAPTNDRADVKTQYKINGVNDLLAPGNAYVVVVPFAEKARAVEIYKYIVANTANLADSKIIIDIENTNGKIAPLTDLELDNPADLSRINTLVNSVNSSDGSNYTPASQLQSLSVSGNKYLFTFDEIPVEAPPQGDPTEATSGTDVTNGTNEETNSSGPASSGVLKTEDKGNYTQVTLSENDVPAAMAELKTTSEIIDNTAADIVIITDFSNGDAGLNEAMRLAVFGYKDDNVEYPGYVQQVKNLLSNDSTAKVTLIALGADKSDENYPDISQDGYYVGSQINERAADDETTGIVEGSEMKFPLKETDNVYRSPTYSVPAANESFWGNTDINNANYNEQNNIYYYQTAFAPPSLLEAAPSSDDVLDEQYADALAEADSILEKSNNPKLIILTDQSRNYFSGKLGSFNSNDVTVVDVDEKLDSSTYKYKKTNGSLTSGPLSGKAIYNSLVTDAANTEAGFICDPAESEKLFNLRDELNIPVFWLENGYATGSGENYDLLPNKCDAPCTYFDATWYLPAIGNYELEGTYFASRRTGAFTNNLLDGDHYYPISDTLNTKVLGASEKFYKNNIPTAAVTYDDRYALEIIKGADFAKASGAKALDSKINYVVEYTNVGEDTLTNLVLTDTQIMAANSYKAYVINAEQKEPASTDKPISITFISTKETDFPNKGEAKVTSLEPGKKIYLTYELTCPEASKATTGTSSYDSTDSTKLNRSYIIYNKATAAADYLELIKAELDTEFMYDSGNGTTTASTTTTTKPSSAPVTPTITAPSTTAAPSSPTTGESSIGYIVAASLLFGAIGVFGVTIYGIVLDRKIERAKATKTIAR